jgi:hypothetical protein
MTRVTVINAQATLDENGGLCPVYGCGSNQIRVTAEPGNDSEPSREHFVCRICDAEWTVELHATQITSILFGEPGSSRYFNEEFSYGVIEKGVFSQIPCPKGPIADALQEFVRQMKMGSVQGKGEALAKLAHLARVDLSSLGGSQPATLPEPLSDTEQLHP